MKEEKGFMVAFILTWGVAVFLCVAFWAAIFYVALHFILKVW